MTSTTEFKFNCPTCGQHILVAAEWTGRPIECPSCNTRLTIPSPPKTSQNKPPLPSATPKPSASIPVDATQTQPALGLSKTRATAVQTPVGPPTSRAVGKNKPADAGAGLKTEALGTDPSQPQRLRIAVLTPEVKLALVRAVRQRIADESRWVPGRIKGVNAYAAKVSNGETIRVDVTSPEASRFSLVGAFLLELRVRRVARTAAGRTKLLDQEIPDAIREVLVDEMSDEEREQLQDPLAVKDPMSITHAQCLAALAVLEARYEQRIEQITAEKARRKLGKTRLGDLVRKLEKKAQIAPEEVATALYHEVMDMQRRLDRLESRTSQNRRSPA